MKRYHILILLSIMIAILIIIQIQSAPIENTAMFFGNLTRDGKPAPIGTEITAFNSSGGQYSVNYSFAYKIGEYGTSANGPMRIYPGNDNDEITFKINGFDATPNGIFCSIFSCPAGNHLDLNCTNCNHPSNLVNGTLNQGSGGLTTLFNFSVTYKDADNDAPIWVNVSIDGINYKMSGNYSNASGLNELKNSRNYSYATTLCRGNHTYKFIAYDGFNTNETSLQQGPNVVSNLSKLKNGTVEPSYSNHKIDFNFTVIYQDDENDAPIWVNVSINGTMHEMSELNPGDNNYMDGKNYYYSTQLNPGSYEYYFLTYDGCNLTQSSTFQGPIVGKLYNTTENFSAGQIKVINATNDTDTIAEIITDSDVSEGEVNITLYRENPLPTSFYLPGVGKYINVEISSEINDSLSSLLLRVYYTQEEISNLNESSLRFYWYNESLGNWTFLNDSWSWVFSSGVDTTNVGEYSGNVYANVSHLSFFAVGGSERGIIPFTIPLKQGWNLISLPLEVI